MPVKNKIKNTKEKVVVYLSTHSKKEDYRDDDEKLVARYWCDELRENKIDPVSISGMEFLKIYSDNELLTSAETIVRARRIAQKDDPELRGKFYKERHIEEDDVRQAIGHGEI
jgi:hypothetical protein